VDPENRTLKAEPLPQGESFVEKGGRPPNLWRIQKDSSGPSCKKQLAVKSTDLSSSEVFPGGQTGVLQEREMQREKNALFHGAN